MIKIVVDTLGGDRSPDVNIEGAIMAINAYEDIEIIFTGDQDVIGEKLKAYTFDKNRVSVVHAPDEITCNDVPTQAIRLKKESSLAKGIELLRANDDINAIVSIGSTGAILAGAVLRTGRIPGVKRPALCPQVPTAHGGMVSICDSGANADCDAEQLVQFAIMGSLYIKKAYGIENPRVALLNVGVEEEKGDMLRKEVYGLLKNNAEINFVGNMESRDLLSGKYDLVVCDGFSGNVLLKTTEGACMEMINLVKGALNKNLKSKIGGLLVKKNIKGVKDLLDYNNYGGAVLLGTRKTVVKGHGSSKALSIFHCIEQAYNMEKNNLREAISTAMENL